MTLTTILGLLAFGVFLYLMMKNGGGCCGGHNHGSHGHQGRDSAHHNQDDQHQQKALEDDDGSQKDPVCGMTVDSRALASEHQGRTFHFCSEQCRKAFELTPLKYTGSTKICR